MTKRATWKGWTLLTPKRRIAVDADFGEPFLWVKKRDALETAEVGDNVVRCELRVVKDKR